MPQQNREQKRRYAVRMGKKAFLTGEPLEANPYRNKGGGCLFYWRWRYGWFKAAGIKT